ncbi:hypothetical protein BH11PSE12_BH11PSE12_07020 [soil metagenome]
MLTRSSRYLRLLSVCSLLLGLLAGCERLGLADPAKDAAIKESDARATGSACRHAGRAIEDCYALNPDAARAAVYAGWKEMNDYMRENKIEEVKPEIHVTAKPAAAEDDSSASASASASSSASSGSNSSASTKSAKH